MMKKVLLFLGGMLTGFLLFVLLNLVQPNKAEESIRIDGKSITTGAKKVDDVSVFYVAADSIPILEVEISNMDFGDKSITVNSYSSKEDSLLLDRNFDLVADDMLIYNKSLDVTEMYIFLDGEFLKCSPSGTGRTIEDRTYEFSGNKWVRQN